MDGLILHQQTGAEYVLALQADVLTDARRGKYAWSRARAASDPARDFLRGRLVRGRSEQEREQHDCGDPSSIWGNSRSALRRVSPLGNLRARGAGTFAHAHAPARPTIATAQTF
jgi:hypothetical protein